MDILDRFLKQAKTKLRSVVFPEGNDLRVIEAASSLANDGVAKPIVLGRPDEVALAAAEACLNIDGVTIWDPQTDSRADSLADALSKRGKGMPVDEARVRIKEPLIFAGMLVSTGQADSLVAGAANETGRVISAGLKTIGLSQGISRLSSFFLMIVPNHMNNGEHQFIFADCAVNIDPDAEQLADIAIASAESARLLLDEPPKVALLSFSTKGSARHDQVDKVTDALALVRSRVPELVVDGELQADAALVPSVAARKVKDGAGVAGSANVLIFPSLDAANIGYKLVQYMANATALGPFFQGFSKPVCDLSRGCSVSDIIGATVITLALAD